MNKIKTLYPTEVGIVEESPLKDSCNRFAKRIDQHIKNSINLKKTECLRQSSQLMEQLNLVRKRSGTYKRKIYEEELEFK